MKVGATEQARQLINKAPQSVVQQFEKQYEHSLAAFPKAGHTMAYQSALLFIKEVETNTSEPISCRAGCGFCCHQPVFASYIEFQGIRDHLLSIGRKVSRETIQNQRNDTDDGIYHKLKVPDRKCVFLGENQSCTIYDVRPLTCRRYNAYSDPTHCASGATSEIKFDVSPRTEGHLSAYFAYYDGDHLAGHLLANPDLLD